MLIYLDMCCLKRPFDDQSQARIKFETEAVLNLLALELERVQFIRSDALLLENALNPIHERMSRVEAWLRVKPLTKISEQAALAARVDALRSLGLKSFDALHIASAELIGADRFVTVDDRLLTAASRRSAPGKAPAISVLDCAMELVR